MPAIPTLAPIANEPLTVALLAGNDQVHVGKNVESWLRFLDGLERDFELLVVADGSSDETPKVIESLAANNPRLRMLRHERPRGEGAALRTAVADSRCPLFFYTLCDPAYKPADLGRLLNRRPDPAKPEKEIDLVHFVTGYRAGVKVPSPLRAVGWLGRQFSRVMFSHAPNPLPGWLGWRRHLLRQVARFVFGIRYQDISCPFRLMRRQIFERIPIQSDGPFAHVELVAKANFLGLMLGGEELALDVVPQPYRGDGRAIWQEAVKVFKKPDFGPAVLPKE
jgi:glycosyltransferase involved in cell wall biosynthesis